MEESEIKIKEEFPCDPFASLETFNNSEDVSGMVHESCDLNGINNGNSDSILECSICLVAFFSHEEFVEHACVQNKEKKPEIEYENQLNFLID